MELVVGIGTYMGTHSNNISNFNNCNNNSIMHVKVGEIQGYDVLYIPEKDSIFCKNTLLNFSLIKKIIRGSMDRTSIPEKEIVIIKNDNVVHLGCLTTTMQNCLDIIKQVNKLKL